MTHLDHCWLSVNAFSGMFFPRKHLEEQNFDIVLWNLVSVASSSSSLLMYIIHCSFFFFLSSRYSTGGKYGFAERIIDGMFVSINSIIVNFRAKAFTASIQVRLTPGNNNSHNQWNCFVRGFNASCALRGQISGRCRDIDWGIDWCEMTCYSYHFFCR